jgi:hypothetical protein
MPIDQSVWKIGEEVKELQRTQLVSENELEEIIQDHIEMLNTNWLVIGRQVSTAFNSYIDLLAIDSNGLLIIIELKKNKTPREVVAQALDYASWVKGLAPEDIAEIYEDYIQKYKSGNEAKSLDEVFREKFNLSLEEDELNNDHQVVIVASSLDSSTERIVSYLADSGISINIVFFKVLEDEGRRYISRAWFLDPQETESKVVSSRHKEPWNGEYYFSFGHGSERNWEDAMQYGFVSAGGGMWYTRTLSQLNIGDRIWVNIPQTGYVGVGKVKSTAKKADEVTFNNNGDRQNIYELSEKADYIKQFIDDVDNAEYIVEVEWIKKFGISEAVKEVGFFGNQNTVCKPTTQKWSHTVERLKKKWGITD